MRYLILTVLAAFGAGAAVGAQPDVVAGDFATELVAADGAFGPAPYDDPAAVLGAPTQRVVGTGQQTYTCSLVYSAWNVTPEGERTVVTLDEGGEIVVGFDHPVADDENNPYGVDFIVFGNAVFTHSSGQYIGTDSDMGEVRLAAATGVYEERVTVSVAQDPNGPWYTFGEGPYADALFPANPYAWDSDAVGWGEALDPLRPVDPALTSTDFGGLTVAEAIALYDGSAGGTGFDLARLAPADYAALAVDPASGRRWIRYVRLTSDEFGEVDAVADVAACGDYRHPRPAGDLNHDCRVDLMDLMALSGSWMECTWKCP